MIPARHVPAVLRWLEDQALSDGRARQHLRELHPPGSPCVEPAIEALDRKFRLNEAIARLLIEFVKATCLPPEEKKKVYLERYIKQLRDDGIRLLTGQCGEAVARETFDYASLLEYVGELETRLQGGSEFSITGPSTTYGGSSGDGALPSRRILICPVCNWSLVFESDEEAGFWGGVRCYVCQHHFTEQQVWAGEDPDKTDKTEKPEKPAHPSA